MTPNSCANKGPKSIIFDMHAVINLDTSHLSPKILNSAKLASMCK